MPALFSNYPSIVYRFQQKNIDIRDITRRVALRNNVKDATSIFFEHNVRDGDRPEDIANRLYGSPHHHWLILMMNDIVDPYFEWVMTSQQILDTLTEQFGTVEDGISESNIHHWETPDGFVIPADGDLRENGANDAVDVGAVSVSWYNWLIEENESRRSIKLVRPDLVSDIIREAEQLLE